MAVSLEQSPVAQYANLVHALRARSRERADELAFIYLSDGRQEEASLTYAQLDHRARAIGARLQEMGLAGERVLLAYPPGLDFVAGLFGCFYAGCVAVPTTLPYRRQRRERFSAIVKDSGARLAMGTADFRFSISDSGLEGGNGRRASRKADSTLALLATDEMGDEWAEQWRERTPGGEDLAMLQYTSGSTSAPKGVMLTHANLIHNTSVISETFNVCHNETSVFWLPTYHDMGLVGGVMGPVVAGVRNVTMSPTTFLQSPITWLEAISRYRASISGGPNFAYDLCVRKVSEEEKAGLDLSSWSLAFVGAEPIQPATLERFARAFEPCGFRQSAFYPCYGLAEATLMVSGPKRGEGVVVEKKGSHERVSCGRPVRETRIVIVDPRSRTEVPEGAMGEVWVAGPSVGVGYWKKASQSRRAFDARLTGDTSAFLRTGDLGFISQGRVFITGRCDDVIIIRGVNRFPQDMEATARLSHPLLEGHGGAAFAVCVDGAERHVLVHEVTRNGAKDYSTVFDAATRAVLEAHGVALDAIVLVRSGSIPRTSSGKIQRFACRDAFVAGGLRIVAQCADGQVNSSTVSPVNIVTQAGAKRQGRRQPTQASSRVAPDRASGAPFRIVCEHARTLSRAPLPDLTPDTPISALGLDSIQRVELAASLEKTFSGWLPNTCDVHTLGELAIAVDEHLMGGAGAGRAPSADSRRPTEVPREHYDVARFPEYLELSHHEQTVREAVGENPYFRVDEGGSAERGAAHIEGRDVVNFCGYDYLGMSRDPQVAAAMNDAIERYGSSAGASRLVSGEKRVHRELEEALARFLGTPDAIVFVSGHATNVTTIGHLLRPGDLIVHDFLAHNSIIQGARLSGASQRAFPHNDWAALDALLTEIRPRYRRVLIAIEGVYSMDGDWPDLPRFIEIKKKHKAILLVDEAHSLGTLGPTGRGIAEHYDVNRAEVDIWMGTLSKALASCGGFIAGSTELVKYLKYTAPGFVYSVGLSPPNAAAALASLTILEREPQRVLQLRDRAALFLDLARKRGLDTGLAAGSPVVPVIVGNSIHSLRLSRALFDRGINVQPILRPAVPEDAARLRFFITVNHTHAQIRTVVDAVADGFAKLKV